MYSHPMLLALSAAALSVAAAGPSAASFTLEGDAGALTLVADQGSRSEVVAAIVAKFGLETVGGSVEDGMVSGRFSGSLGHILKSILPRNGYAIAYSNGRPVRVTFTGQGNGAAVADPSGQAWAQGIVVPPTGMVPQPVATMAGAAEQLVQQSIVAPSAGNSEPPVVPTAAAGDASSGQSDMQSQIAEATARARAQLKALTGDLSKIGQ